MPKAVVIGLARSGVGAANLLAQRGWDVTVTDRRDVDELAPHVKSLLPSVGLALGGHPPEIFNAAELVVISPGVPLSAPPVQEALSRGIEVIGELELAWRHFSGGPEYYAVTGTNGKSTTVTLLDMMMSKAGKRSALGGNIGTSLCALLDGGGAERLDCAVVEVSSFQLETIKEFRPRVAAILNVTPDHMDRYDSLEHYRDAKARIAMNQSAGDSLVLNADCPLTVSVSAMAPQGSEVYYFSSKGDVRGVYLDDSKVMYRFGPGAPTELMDAQDIAIRGSHNLENAMAATAIAMLGGCTADAVRQALREFSGLEHRLEFVRRVNGVTYINDSKGTNVGAVMKSIESFSTPIVLIAGGRDKDGDFTQLVPGLKARARGVVLMGEAAQKIKAAIGGAVECHMAGSMEDAVYMAASLASEGDSVVLSPACASFDMFSSFEHRGEEFKKAVRSL